MIQAAVRRLSLIALITFSAGAVASGQDLRPISIGPSSNSISVSAPRIAAELGLYAKHGLSARIVSMDSASVASSALISGSIDVAVVNPTDAVLANARGQDLVVIRSVYAGFPGVLVLSKSVSDTLRVSPTADIASRLRALDGLLIASLSATTSYTVSLKAAAEAEGARVRFTYMAQPAMVSALKTGAIQGFVASSPFHAMAVLNGSGVVWINGPKGEYPPRFALSNSITLVAKRSYALANPDVIRRLNAVFDDVSRAVEQRPGDVKAALVRLFPDVDAATLDLIWEAEGKSFVGRVLTKEDIVRTIDFVKLGGASLPDNLDPESMLLR